jgi:hypothetical protein
LVDDTVSFHKRLIVECSAGSGLYFRVQVVTIEKTAVFFRLSRQTRDHQGEKLGCSRARDGGHFLKKDFAKNPFLEFFRKLGERKDKFHCYQHTIIIG